MKHRIALAGVLAGLVLAPVAQADVTYRVEGSGPGALLAPTAVPVTGPAVVKDGNPAHSCAGDTAAAGLERATAGAWGGTWSESQGYAVETIKGESYPFSQSAYFWSFVVDGKPASTGVCGVKLADNQEVVLYKACFQATSGCYDGTILEAAPASTRVVPGGTVDVVVQQAVTTFTATSSSVQRSPAGAVSLTAGGPAATTAADGRARVSVGTARGPVALRATKGANVPDQVELCVTDGQDGFCGTTKPGAAPAPQLAPAPCATTGSDGFCGSPDRIAGLGDVTSVRQAQRFARGRGPRELRGTVTREAKVAKVELRLTGNDRGRCSRFDAVRERVVRMSRCGAGRGRFFTAATTADWSYLLPQRLGRGRWVLDVRVTDGAGNVNRALLTDRSRVRFNVG